MTDEEVIPLGNGDIVKSRELMDVERRLTKKFDGAIDHLEERYVLRKEDQLRHKSLNSDINRIERKVDGSLVAVFVGICGALWAFLKTRFGV